MELTGATIYYHSYKRSYDKTIIVFKQLVIQKRSLFNPRLHWSPSIVGPSIVENPSLIDMLGLTNGFFTTYKPLNSRRFSLDEKIHY